MDKEFKAKFTADNKDLKNKMTEVESRGDKFKAKMKTLGIALAAVFAIDKIVQFGKEIIGLAAKTEGVKIAFERLNDPTLLDDLRKATRGTVSDLQLMQKAVQAKNFKIPLDQLATYFEFATKRAIQTGESVDYLVDSIITGIGRKSVLVMDNLGISAVALQDEVKKVGDFGTAAGNIIRSELTSMGDVADTVSTKITSLAVTFTNFKTALGTKLIQATWFQNMLGGVQAITALLNKQGEFEGLSKDQLIIEKEKLEAQREQLLLGNEAIKQEIGKLTVWDRLLGKSKQLNIDAKNNGKSLTENKDKLAAINAILDKTHPSGSTGEILTGSSKRELITIAKVDTSHLALPHIAPKVDTSSLEDYGFVLEKIEERLTAAQFAAQSFGEQVMLAGIQGAGSLEKFGFTAINIAKKVIAAYVAEGIAAAVKSALIDVPFPFNIAAAGIAGGLAAAVINAAIPEFAAGGGVSGPTMALVGEAPGISRSNPEYIGTASQLSQMGIGGGQLSVRVSRGDLLFMLNEGKSYNSRNY